MTTPIDVNDLRGGTNTDDAHGVTMSADGGDDTVRAGDDLLAGTGDDDLLLGGSGNDRADGGAGDDTIFGDAGGRGTTSLRDVFQWDLAPNTGASDFSQNTGNVIVTFSEENGGASDNISTEIQNVTAIETGPLGAVDSTSSLDSVTNGPGNSDTYSLSFSDPVENVSFRVNDVDGDGVVRIQAFDVSGDLIEVQLDGGSNVTLLDTDSVAGADSADSNGGYGPDISAEYSVLVTIPGPVSQIQIFHVQDGSGNSGVNVTDVYFDVPNAGPPAGDGDDTLLGGEGDDLIYGNGGDDSIQGNSGDDTLFGDDPADGTVVSGNLIFNGSFEITSGMNTRGYGFVAMNGDAPGWTDASGGQIDFHNDGRGGIEPTDGQNWLDLEASPGNGRIGQDVEGIQVGETYRLTFDAGDKSNEPQSGAGENLIEVYWGGELIALVDPEAGQMDRYTFEVKGGAGDGSDRLDFVGRGDLDNFGASIDDVVLVQLASPPGDGGNDTIAGGSGDDVIDGQGGDDVLDGGAGDDTITGGAGDDLIVGGPGADSLDGGTGNDTFAVGTSTDPVFGNDEGEGLGDTIVGGEGPGNPDAEEDVLDLTGSVDFDILYEDSMDPTGMPGESGRVVFYTDDTKTTAKGELVFKEIETVIPCFTPGAMIATPRGEVPVESLREGDKVITRDNGIQEIRWTGHRTLNRAELARDARLKPIRIRAGALGPNLPERDMLVSPQHRVLVTGETPQIYFEESEVLVAAKHLIGQAGVSVVDTLRTTYIHFMFDCHEVVLSDGAWTESFQPGDHTLGSMGTATRDEIVALFPDLATHGGLTEYAAARRSLKAHEAQLLQL
ncbi:Hint domain-containing protein [Jannaschia sp. CCS1]|uniref:Hint domain-containing protein n=1 Tax=Jannaschia sp. (strain CCS1) TaxID=290400 RepID=UPI000053BD7C|nr:Hint domain-containing protein [Jannaschia sp. CCS1]ABD55407.1 Hemolysin-type calcium-binding protein [Jannaschia sp. CCS1]